MQVKKQADDNHNCDYRKYHGIKISASWFFGIHTCKVRYHRESADDERQVRNGR